jgi:hypothetical protein
MLLSAYHVTSEYDIKVTVTELGRQDKQKYGETFLKERPKKKRSGWENTNNTDLCEVGCYKVDWTGLSQNRVQLKTV